MHRIQLVQKKIKTKGVSGILISKPENVYYLSQFSGTNGRLFITPKKAYLITDFRYLRSAKKQIPAEIEIYDQVQGLIQLIGRIKSIGFEGDDVSYNDFLRLKSLLKGVKLKSISGLIENLRMIKTNEEVKIIKKGVKTANKIFEKFIKSIKKGQSENEMEWNLTCISRELGAEGFSFPPIIAFGKNTSNVHHKKGSAKLKKGQPILIDFGIKYKGYMTDMTRMIYTKPLTLIEQKIYSIVLEANNRAIDEIAIGKKLAKVDAAARSYIVKAGYGEYFGHSTGHGVGVEIHEKPNVSAYSKEKIRPGMVITIEPGIYTPNDGGVRIEDMVYINPNGKAEVLTDSVTKKPRVIKV